MRDKKEFYLLILLFTFPILWEFVVTDVLNLSVKPILFILLFGLLTISIFGGSILYLKLARDRAKQKILIIGLLTWQSLRLLLAVVGREYRFLIFPSILAYLSFVMVIYAIIKRVKISRKSFLALIIFVGIFLLLSTLSTHLFFDRDIFWELANWFYYSMPFVVFSLVWEKKISISLIHIYSLCSIISFSAYPISWSYFIENMPLLNSLIWILQFVVFYWIIPVNMLFRRNKPDSQWFNLSLIAVTYLVINILYFQVLSQMLSEGFSIPLVIRDSLKLWFPFLFLFLNNVNIDTESVP